MPKRLIQTILFLMGLGSTFLNSQEIPAPYVAANWSSSGIMGGDVEIYTGSQFHLAYAVDLGDGIGVSNRTAEVSIPAAASGTVSFNYEYVVNHRFFSVDVIFTLFATGPDGETEVEIVRESEPADDIPVGKTYRGVAAIAVQEGYPFGIRIGGGNSDANSRINGDLVLSNFKAPVIEQSDGLAGAYSAENWTKGEMLEGTTGISSTTALEGTYQVNLGNPGTGVSRRVSEYSGTAAGTGTLTFDYLFKVNHAFASVKAELTLFADGPDGETTLTLVNESEPGNDIPVGKIYAGTASIAVTEGFAFGWRAGGSNFDYISYLNGSLTIFNFSAPDSTGSAIGLTGAYDPANFSTSGISGGTATVGAISLGQFSYAVDLGNPGPGVSRRTAQYSALANASGTATFDYAFKVNHAYVDVKAELTVFADGPDGETTQVFLNVAEPDTSIEPGALFSGSVSIPVFEGYAFGVRAGGSNYDYISYLNGSLTIANFAAPAHAIQTGFQALYGLDSWSLTSMPEGVVDISTPATVNMEYAVDLGYPGPGVSLRTADYFLMAPRSGTFRFDYVYSVNHRFFAAAAEFSTLAGSSSGTTNKIIIDVQEPEIDLPVGSFFTGTEEIKVSAGHEFGFTIGGSNFDSISGLNGTLEISNVSVTGPWTEADYVSGWLDSWFGWIKDVNPPASLIYHLQLGYLYYNGQSSQSVWFYLPSGNFGWAFTSQNFFPYFYMPNKGWFYKYPDSNWFLDLQSQQWVEYTP